jgi:DNA-binding NarL/FixJ family response regulator
MAYRVLIVDDQREVSRLLRSALETIEHGLEVFEARSGEEAILESSRGKFDLLVADFRLPGMSGVELMRKIKARNPHMKVILVSGVSDPKSKDEVNKAGADAFFAKPVPMADFLDAVERLLGMERTILPTETAAKIPERKTLSDMIVNLRKQLKADAVVLLSDRGRVIAQAGELPDPNMGVSLISTLMAIYSAAQKVSLLVEHTASADLHIFRGDKVDLLFAPVGVVHAILISGPKLATGSTLPKTIDILNGAQAEIEKALQLIGTTGSLSPSVVDAYEAAQAAKQKETKPEPEVEEAPGDFEELLKQASQKVKVDPNSFWDQAVEKGAAFVLKDTLSFDEASKLGLAPDAKKNT